MNSRNLFIALVLTFISGCAVTPDPVITTVTQRVEVPIPVACKEKAPPPPEYCFPKLMINVSIFEKTKCLLSDRKLKDAHIKLVEAALKSCQ